MTGRLSPFDPRGLPHQLLDRRLLDRYVAHTAPGISGPELNAQLEREWAHHQAAEKARREQEADILERRLAITGMDAYTALGKAIGGVTTQKAWVSLSEEIDALAEAGRLARGHKQELDDRLLRVARHKGWTTS